MLTAMVLKISGSGSDSGHLRALGWGSVRLRRHSLVPLQHRSGTNAGDQHAAIEHRAQDLAAGLHSSKIGTISPARSCPRSWTLYRSMPGCSRISDSLT